MVSMLAVTFRFKIASMLYSWEMILLRDKSSSCDGRSRALQLPKDPETASPCFFCFLLK